MKFKRRQKVCWNQRFYWRHKINEFHAWNSNNSSSSMTLIPATTLHFVKGMKSLNLNILLLPSKRFYHSAYEISPHRAIKWMTIKYLFLKCLKYCLRWSIKNINVVFSWIYVQPKWIFNTYRTCRFFHKYLIRHLNRRHHLNGSFFSFSAEEVFLKWFWKTPQGDQNMYHFLNWFHPKNYSMISSKHRFKRKNN